MKNLICIKTYAHRDEAELAKNLLEASGVKAVVSVDDVGGSHPGVGWGSGGARLMVKAEDQEKALKILNN